VILSEYILPVAEPYDREHEPKFKQKKEATIFKSEVKRRTLPYLIEKGVLDVEAEELLSGSKRGPKPAAQPEETEQFAEAIQRSDEPVSRITFKSCGGVPMKIGLKYSLHQSTTYIFLISLSFLFVTSSCV
jgi:hypothetical protein